MLDQLFRAFAQTALLNPPQDEDEDGGGGEMFSEEMFGEVDGDDDAEEEEETGEDGDGHLHENGGSADGPTTNATQVRFCPLRRPQVALRSTAGLLLHVYTLSFMPRVRLSPSL